MVSDATHQSSKWRKPRKHASSSSISSKDSILANPTLPQELIVAILVRLPVKYILPFKCVSKDWYALISGPDFVKAHLHFSAKDYTCHRLLLGCVGISKPSLRYCDVSSLFYKSFTESFDLKLPVKPAAVRCYPAVVGSVNGLICLNIRVDVLILWNPCMGKFMELPIMPKTTVYGFGYDEYHDDYKVLVISYSNGDAYIFSLKSDSWRRLEDFPGRLSYHYMATFVNGKLYWKVTKGGDGCGIMSYDLVDEKWEKVEPPWSRVGGSGLLLGLLGGELCVLHNYEGSHCEVWVMKENGVNQSWTKLYSIKYPDGHVNRIYSQPLCISNEGELLLRYDSTLTVYNPKDDSIRYPLVSSNFAAKLYMESLVCPILQNEARGHNKVVGEWGM